jgi:3-deoxy-D-manno-octulosonic-acid transferase
MTTAAAVSGPSATATSGRPTAASGRHATAGSGRRTAIPRGRPADSSRRARVGARARRWRGFAAVLSLLYLALAPAAAALLAHRVWLRRRALAGLREKLTGEVARPMPGLPLFHGVSLGEVTLLRALLPPVLAALGETRALLTTTTETGRAGLDKHFPDQERAFLPFDLPTAVASFLTRTRPRAVVLLEAEWWPQLLAACFARGIPVVVVNARMSARSYQRYAQAGAAARALFGNLSLVLAQNGVYAARLARLGVPRDRLHVCGSLKADVVTPAPPAAAAAERKRLGLGIAPLFLCASTSDGEEEALVKAWQRHCPSWRLVICPRHPERGADLVALCAKSGVAATRSSTLAGAAPAADHAVIVDEIGRLGALYAAATPAGLAIVGGSLGSGRGGQNMLEAAAAGCCTVVGWDVRNQPDAMVLLRTHQGVVELPAAGIDAAIAALANDPARREAIGAAGRAAWASGRGAGARTARLLADFIRDHGQPSRKTGS